MRSSSRLWLAYLSGGFGLGISAMIGILAPLRAEELGESVAGIGIIVSARACAEVLLTVPCSVAISRIGPRVAFLLGTGLCGLAALGFTVAEDLWVLVALSAVTGAGRVLAWVASQAYISSRGATEVERARNAGRFSFVSSASQMVTPILVGVTATFAGYRLTFLVVAVYCFAFTLLALALQRDAPAGPVAPFRLVAAARLLTLPRLQTAMILTFVRLAIPSIWQPFVPLLLVSSAGFSVGVAGAVISAAAAVGMVVSLTAGRLSAYASPEALCIVALVSAVAGIMLVPHVLSMPAVFLAAVLIGVGDGLSLPLLIVLVSEAAPPGQRNLAIGARNAVNSLSAAIAPLGVAPLVSNLGAVAAFSTAGGVLAVLLSAAAALSTVRTRGRSIPPAASDETGSPATTHPPSQRSPARAGPVKDGQSGVSAF
jgi:DHA1 family inner membrane transport protein